MTANHEMTTTTEEAELHRHQIEEVRLLSLTAERDALTIRYRTEMKARFKAEAEFSHMQRRIARQRRALAKLYQRRNDKNTRLSGFLTGMTAAVATARKDALEEAARLARHYATIVPMHGSLKCDIYEAAGQAATEIAASIEALVEKELLSEDIIRADRDAWPDYQANDPVRPLGKGDSVSLTPQQQSVMEKALMQSVESKGEGDD